MSKYPSTPQELVMRACRSFYKIAAPIIDEMPDLRPTFSSSEAISSLDHWSVVRAWALTLAELESLASIDAAHPDHVAAFSFALTSHKNITSCPLPLDEYPFHTTYPAISWCLVRTRAHYVSYLINNEVEIDIDTLSPSLITARMIALITKPHYVEPLRRRASIKPSKVLTIADKIGNLTSYGVLDRQRLVEHTLASVAGARSVAQIAQLIEMMSRSEKQQLLTMIGELKHEIGEITCEIACMIVRGDRKLTTQAMFKAIVHDNYEMFMAMVDQHLAQGAKLPTMTLLSLINGVESKQHIYVAKLQLYLTEKDLDHAVDSGLDRALVAAVEAAVTTHY